MCNVSKHQKDHKTCSKSLLNFARIAKINPGNSIIYAWIAKFLTFWDCSRDNLFTKTPEFIELNKISFHENLWEHEFEITDSTLSRFNETFYFPLKNIQGTNIAIKNNIKKYIKVYKKTNKLNTVDFFSQVNRICWLIHFMQMFSFCTPCKY